MNNNRNANNNNRRRGRGPGNNRQQGGQQLNRIDSRARGNAPQMLEKYRKLAHDAHLNGDRVTEEYNLQFADHYFRVIADQRVRQDEQRQPRPNGASDRPSEYGDDYAEDDFYGDVNSPYDRAGNYAPSMQNNSQSGNSQSGNSQGNNSQGNNSQAGNGQGNGAQGYAGQGNGAQGNGAQGNEAQGVESRGNDNRGNNQSGGYQNSAAQGANMQSGNAPSGSGQVGAGENRGRRADRNERSDRGERNDRQDRRERPERAPRIDAAAELPQDGASDAAAQAPSSNAGVQEIAAQNPGVTPSVYEATENPFVRADRAPRAPRARKPRREDAPQAAAETGGELALEAPRGDEPSGNLDPASLPPAISRRDEPVEDAPAKPKRRTRRATPPADDAAGALESVN